MIGTTIGSVNGDARIDYHSILESRISPAISVRNDIDMLVIFKGFTQEEANALVVTDRPRATKQNIQKALADRGLTWDWGRQLQYKPVQHAPRVKYPKPDYPCPADVAGAIKWGCGMCRTMSNFSKQVGISDTALYKIMHKTNKPTEDTKRKIFETTKRLAEGAVV